MVSSPQMHVCRGRNHQSGANTLTGESVLGNHGTSYLRGLFLCAALPMGNGMWTFMILPRVLWVRDLQMASGFQQS